MTEFDYGYAIRIARNAKNLTQAELAYKVGCTASAISRLEANDRNPSMQMLEAIAQALGLSLVQLLATHVVFTK